MQEPVVSILIPSFKSEAFIARAVNSVLNQTFQNFEIVIVSDDGQDYISVLDFAGIKDSRIRMVNTGSVGTGISHARNTGLAAAKGDIIAPLDADDLFYPNKLELMVPLAARHGFCSCAVNHTRYEDDTRILIRDLSIAKRDGFLTPQMYLTVNISGNSMVVFDRRQVPQCWREDFAVMEDLLFSLSAFNYLPAIYHLNTPLYEYINTPNSLSNSPEAPRNFIAAKKRILELLDKGELGISNPASVSAFRHFIIVSLKTEHAYAKAMEAGEKITFLELLEEALKQNHLI